MLLSMIGSNKLWQIQSTLSTESTTSAKESGVSSILEDLGMLRRKDSLLNQPTLLLRCVLLLLVKQKVEQNKINVITALIS